MRPTTKLLKPARATPRIAKAAVVVREHEVLNDRKRALEADREIVKASPAKVSKHLDDLLSMIRKDSLERPLAIEGAVVVRVIGAVCGDRTPVPLPNLRVTIIGADKTTEHAKTDVTGLAILPMPKPPERGIRADYKLVVTAGDGSTVANVDANESHSHLVSLGDIKSLEAHATIGRAWMAAIDRADKLREPLVKTAREEIAVVDKLTTTRLTAITKRLDLHLKK